MDWITLSETLRPLWSVWLMALFVGIALWAFWPGRARDAAMKAHADIPLRDDE